MLDFVRQPPLPFCQVRNSARNRKMENQTIEELAIIQRRSGNKNGQKQNDREKKIHPRKRKKRNGNQTIKVAQRFSQNQISAWHLRKKREFSLNLEENMSA